MKIIRAINVDEKVWQEFKLYSCMINSSISKELEKYMKKTLKEINKK